jgi:hypothetical protein
LIRFRSSNIMSPQTSAISSWQPDFHQRSPIFEPVVSLAESLAECQDWPGLSEFQGLLQHLPPIVTGGGHNIHFVSPEKGAVEEMHGRYEPRIYLKGEIQTRSENWHDFFNVLVWLTFPEVKVALNSRHYFELGRHGVEGPRGKVRDALTVFDESGVIVLSSNLELLELMRQFRWKELFWQRRTEVMQEMKFLVFGHALYEKSLLPYIGMTGMSLLFEVSPEFFQKPLSLQVKEADALAASYVAREGSMSSTKELWPLPLLGVPGWWPENQQEMFYDNKQYFRPKRHHDAASSSKVSSRT